MLQGKVPSQAKGYDVIPVNSRLLENALRKKKTQNMDSLEVLELVQFNEYQWNMTTYRWLIVWGDPFLMTLR